MRQRPENFNPADEDPEATLVAPRFDEDDARRAHPLVPFARARAPRVTRARAPRRSWTNALMAVALFAVAALGGALATKFMQGQPAERVREAEQVQEQTQAAPVRTAQAAPPPQPSAPQAADAPREDAATAEAMSREARTRHARAAASVVRAEPAREDAYDEEERGRRAKASEKRREREDEVEKEMRKALKRARGKAPRLVDVLTSSP
ncbi:MAG TPA: hypothetical protein VF586_04160 [Pyrinomonadaceae bacterium]|jgi:type IV secretory pathway VirB10-like protein